MNLTPFILWIASTSLAWSVGWGLTQTLSELGYVIVGGPFGGVVAGLIAGLFQARILRVEGGFRSDWIRARMLGWGFGWLIAALGNFVALAIGFGISIGAGISLLGPAMVASGLAFGTLAGLTSGTVHRRILGRDYARIPRVFEIAGWAIALGLAFPIGVGVSQDVTADLWLSAGGTMPLRTAETMAGLRSGLLMGAIAGGILGLAEAIAIRRSDRRRRLDALGNQG